jgi:hypothetical protein
MIDFLFALVLLADTPTSPTPPTAPAAVTQPASPEAPVAPSATETQRANDQMVCKRVQTGTGSRLGRGQRVCRPAHEWEDAEQGAQKATSDISRSWRGNGGDQ